MLWTQEMLCNLVWEGTGKGKDMPEQTLMGSLLE